MERDATQTRAVPSGPLPSGTVTFLFTDIEGSTELFHRLGDAYAEPLERHRTLVRSAVADNGGIEVAVEGDGFFFAFADAKSALCAAVAAQRSLTTETWAADAMVRVRMGLHTGDATATESGYVALAVHEAARVSAAAHGGQILATDTTLAAAAALPSGFGFQPLGRFRLKGFDAPVALVQVMHPDIDPSSPAPRAAPEARHNLPTSISSFVGREQEQADIAALLDRARLVTLTGNGGAGKTSLAIRVATARIDKHADGVWFVDLAPISDAEVAAATTAAAVGVTVRPERVIFDDLVAAMAERHLLLVVDNCEHLLPAVASFIQALLHGCPGVHVLATSRERLAIDGESVYRVPSLSLPPKDVTDRGELERSDAFRLFDERAAACGTTFGTADEMVAAVSICHRLDGIPLALELAAARLSALSVVELERRLDAALPILTGGARTAPTRQQTLRATIEWSYDLLEPAERSVFTCLSVFAGGFDLDTAEHVCAAIPQRAFVLDALTALVDKSLVQHDARASDRYRLLETVREFAREQLRAQGVDVHDAVHTAHRDAYLSLAERAAPELCGAGQQAWFDRLEREQDNLRAALAFCAASIEHTDDGLRLALALVQFWKHARAMQEGAAAITALLDETGADVPLERRASASLACFWLLFWCGRYDEARPRLDATFDLLLSLEDPALHAEALVARSQRAVIAGDYDEGIAAARQAVAMLPAASGCDTWLLHMAYGARGAAHAVIGDHETARVDFEIALRYDREAGNRWDAGTALAQLAWTDLGAGDIDAARARVQEAYMLGRVDSSALQLIAGQVAMLDGNIESAEELCRDAIARMHRTGDHDLTPFFMRTLAGCAARRGASERAVQLFGASDLSVEQRGESDPPFDADIRRKEIAGLRARMGETAYRAAYDRGRSLTAAEALTLALAAD